MYEYIDTRMMGRENVIFVGMGKIAKSGEEHEMLTLGKVSRRNWMYIGNTKLWGYWEKKIIREKRNQDGKRLKLMGEETRALESTLYTILSQG